MEEALYALEVGTSEAELRQLEREALRNTERTSRLAQAFFQESEQERRHRPDLIRLAEELEEAEVEANAMEEGLREAEGRLEKATTWMEGRSSGGCGVSLPGMSSPRSSPSGGGRMGWSAFKTKHAASRSLAAGIQAMNQGEKPWWQLSAPTKAEMKGLNTEVYSMQKALLESPKPKRKVVKAELEKMEKAWYQVTAEAIEDRGHM